MSDLALSATKSGGMTAVKATWSPGTNATKYGVRLSSAGVTLDSSTVTTLTWTGHTTIADGSTVTVTVTSYNGTRKGGVRTANLVLPDLTAPVASYAVAHTPEDVGKDVVVTATSLSDNLTPKGSIVQTIDWGDGTSPQPWNPMESSIPHPYPDAVERYEAAVTLTDLAGNSAVYPLVIVVQDISAPEGQFTLSRPTAWAGWTKVGVNQVSLQDNLSPADKVTKVISWGDGSQTEWKGGAAPTHVYAAAGSYSPTVWLTDEGGNTSDALPTSTVVVKVDAAAPVLKLKPPATRKKSVRSWRVLKGTATDAGVGVRNVTVKAIEKRGTSWYAYKAATHTWVKAATKARAWAKATTASVKPTAAGAWSLKLARLTKGTLLYKARGYDNRGNASAWVSKKALLTRR